MLAEAYANAGHNVLFVTAPFSFLFKLRKHYFNKLDIIKNRVVPVTNNISFYVHSTPFHIANFKFKWLNFITKYLYTLYQTFPLGEAKYKIQEADQIIFESTPGLFLFQKIRKLNKNARLVYRVSDDLELLGVHPSLLSYEKKILKDFDLVSVASSYVLRKLRSKCADANIKLHFHGLKKELFDMKMENPYDSNKINALFLGVANLDYEFIRMASELRKDINLHVIGPFEKRIVAENIIYYGEMPYMETIRYVKYADIALHTITYYKGAESLGESSLKSIQYTYCNLPIIAPSFLENPNRNLFIYSNYNEVEQVLGEAVKAISEKQMKESEIYSWEVLTKKLDE